MDFNAIVESLMALVRHSGGAVVVYACLVCLLTEIIKRLFIPKLKIDLNGKFDPTILVPFALGCCASVFHAMVVMKTGLSGAFDNIVVNGLTIGATAMVIYRMLASLFGDSVKKLCKDDLFNLFYTEIFVYSDVVSEKAGEIYLSDLPDDQKKQKLAVLMSGLIDDGIIYKVIDPIHNLLVESFKADGTEE